MKDAVKAVCEMLQAVALSSWSATARLLVLLAGLTCCGVIVLVIVK